MALINGICLASSTHFLFKPGQNGQIVVYIALDPACPAGTINKRDEVFGVSIYCHVSSFFSL